MRRLFPSQEGPHPEKFAEFKAYLADRKRAGVVELAGNQTMYLVPPIGHMCSVAGVPTWPDELWMLVLIVPNDHPHHRMA